MGNSKHPHKYSAFYDESHVAITELRQRPNQNHPLSPHLHSQAYSEANPREATILSVKYLKLSQNNGYYTQPQYYNHLPRKKYTPMSPNTGIFLNQYYHSFY